MKKKNLLLMILLATGFLGACGGGDATSTSVDETATDTTFDEGSSTTFITDSTNSSDSSVSSDSTVIIIPGEMHNVKYDLNYASVPLLYHMEDVESGSLLTPPANPSRQGYDFVKWWKDSYCRPGTEWVFASDIVVNDVILYASWERNAEDIGDELLTLSWEAVGASFVPVDDLSLPREVEEATTVRFKISIFENYEGTPVVKANAISLTADGDGIYSYTVATNVVFSITGLTQMTSATYRIYYTNLNGWDNVNAYMWDAEGTFAVDWPGEPMILDAATTYYFIEIDPSAGYTNIIFNNGTAQTTDLDIVYFGTDGTVYMGLGTNPTAHKWEGQIDVMPDYTFASLGLRGSGSGLSWTASTYFINSNGQTYLDIRLTAGTSFKLHDDVSGWNNNTVGLMTGAASGNFGIDSNDNNNITVSVTGNYHLLWDGTLQKVVVTLN